MTDWSGVAVVVVGSMNVDQVVYCERFPEDGETLVARRYAQGFGGKGANQAVMAARLGARVAMVGCLGDDDLGGATMANLAAHGVDATGVARVAGTSSGVAPIWVDATGTNRILIVPGANAAVTADHVERALGGRSADVVVAQLETPQAATSAAFGWARRVGAITILNPAPAAAVEPSVLARTDWLVANESEFRILSRRRPGAGDGERGLPDVGLRCGRHPRPRRRARRHRGPAHGRRRCPGGRRRRHHRGR